MIKQVLTLAALAAFSAGALADNCTAEVHGTKSFAQGYLDGANKKIEELVVPKSCKSFTINLTHSGTAKDSPKATMGHNLVLSTTADANAVAADARRLQLQAWCMPRLHQAFCRSGTWVTMSA